MVVDGVPVPEEPIEHFDTSESHEGNIFRFLFAQRTYTKWVNKLPDGRDREKMRLVSGLFEEARVFEVPVEMFYTMWRYFGGMNTTSMVECLTHEGLIVPDDIIEFCKERGVTYMSPGQIVQAADAKYEKEHGRGILADHKVTLDAYFSDIAPSVPSRLPFPVCYFGFEGPVPRRTDEHFELIGQVLQNVHADDLEHANMVGIPQLMGYLVSHEYCFSLLYSEFGGRGIPKRATHSYTLIPVLEYEGVRQMPTKWAKRLKKGIWRRARALMPWIVDALVAWVHDHKTITDSQYNPVQYRRDLASAAQNLHIRKPIPPPYYVVYLQDTVEVDAWNKKRQARAGRIRRPPGHRYDVRSHDPIRVLRGPLPLKDKVRKKLEKHRKGAGRGYYIFTDTQPDGKIADLLFKRGVRRKKPHEWMAVLITPIADRIQGPLDAPYVPSVRKSRKHAKEDDHDEI
jgi:hypothetical protein